MVALAGLRSTVILHILRSGIGATTGAAGQRLLGLRKIIRDPPSSYFLSRSIKSARAGRCQCACDIACAAPSGTVQVIGAALTGGSRHKQMRHISLQ